MTDTAQDALEDVTQETPVSILSSRSTAKQLVQVRRRLAREMLVRVGGFEYESIFGTGVPLSGGISPSISHVAVRVELRSPGGGGLNVPYHFQVLVDFHLPMGASLKEAEHFRRATNNAVKRAEWAQDLVRGLAWDDKTVMSLEVE